jgi:hypothetical protein
MAVEDGGVGLSMFLQVPDAKGRRLEELEALFVRG